MRWLALALGLVICATAALGDETMLVDLRRGDVDALARVVWAESRSEPWEGQCAVVWVVINRLHREKGRFPSTVQGVVYQAKAFSCFNTDDPQCRAVRVVNESDYDFVKALNAVTSVLTGKVPDVTNGSDHYYAQYMKHPPSWAAKMTLQARIGQHIFLSEKPID
jgi:N-acetylmuramoyl-L-alanine amidase